MSNIDLYYKGLWANTVKFFGYVIIFFGLWSLFLSVWLAILLCIIGIAVVVHGHALRFDYKMQSGIIIHGGDR